jgi:hypothetical protein
VLRRAAMLFNKPLDVLEAGDDAFLAGERPLGLSGSGEVGQFRPQFVEINVSHSAPHP